MVASRARAFVRRIPTRQLTSRLEFEDAIAVTSISDVFGLDRGTPLDRVFINRFLQQNREIIRGDCLEVEEPSYTRKFDQPGQPGHVATSCLFLQGVSYEDIPDRKMLDITDPNHQMVVCAVVRK